MKESFGNAFVFTFIMIFVAIALFVLIGSMSYSKAAKIKNRIVNIVENYAGEHNTVNSKTFELIDADLGTIGYRINASGKNSISASRIPSNCTLINSFSDYRYAVMRCCAERGVYYRVVSYMYFDIPLLGDFIEIPISGETKVFYKITPGNSC